MHHQRSLAFVLAAVLALAQGNSLYSLPEFVDNVPDQSQIFPSLDQQPSILGGLAFDSPVEQFAPLNTASQISYLNPDYDSHGLSLIPSTSINHLTYDLNPGYHSTGGEHVFTANDEDYSSSYHCPHTPRCRSSCRSPHPFPYHPYYPYRRHLQDCPHMCSDLAHLRTDISGVRSLAYRIAHDVNAILRLRKIGVTSDDLISLRDEIIAVIRSELRTRIYNNEPKPYVPVEKPYVPQYVPEKPYVPQYNKPTVPQQYARVPEEERPKYHQKREAFFTEINCD